MANMSYCRFENTLSDLRDCYNHFDQGDLSMEEHNARARMIELMVEILQDVGAEVEDEFIHESYTTRR